MLKRNKKRKGRVSDKICVVIFGKPLKNEVEKIALARVCQ